MVDDKKLHALLLKISAAHKKHCRQSFQDLGLTEGQPKVLAFLQSVEGCLQKELADLCHVEQATMTSLLKNMEQSGLIEKRKEVSGGKRVFRVYLTQYGKEMAKKVDGIVDSLENICFSGFSKEEKEQFLTMFAKISDNLLA